MDQESLHPDDIARALRAVVRHVRRLYVETAPTPFLDN